MLVAAADEAGAELLAAFEVETADVALDELEVGLQLASAPPKGLAQPGVYFWVEAGAIEVLTAYLARKLCTSSHWQPVKGLNP